MDRPKLGEAARALGIDPSALAFESPRPEPEPEPLPELKIDPVTDDEMGRLRACSAAPSTLLIEDTAARLHQRRLLACRLSV